MKAKNNITFSRAKMAFRYLVHRVRVWPPVERIHTSRRIKAQIRFCRDDLKLRGLVFDIGAHAGIKTNIFLQCDCSVIVVEPQPRLAERLRTAYANNPSVTVEQKGIGEKDGIAVINISSRYSGFSSFNKSWQEGTKYHTFDSTETVAVTTLDALIGKYGLPYFCKIDVEGFEPQVLAGLTTKIPLLNFEFHSNDSAHITACVERLQKIGYTEFNFVLAEDPHMASAWTSADQICAKIVALGESEKILLYGDVYAR